MARLCRSGGIAEPGCSQRLSDLATTADRASQTPLSVRSVLQAAGKRVAPLDARILLQHALGAGRAQLSANSERRLTRSELDTFEPLLGRRQDGEPVAYIIGRREFFSLDFEVTPAVLIPRPETEVLVELTLVRIPPEQDFRVLDLGTGSGAIAILLARHRPAAEITGTDISEKALAIAERNARNLLAAGGAATTNPRFIHSDWFAGLAGKRFDLIVANPPYVAALDPHLTEGDVRFEPRLALVAGDDGLSCIRRIVDRAPRHLSAGGWLLFEHGYDQAGACRELLGSAGFFEILSQPDLAGIPRVAGGRNQYEF